MTTIIPTPAPVPDPLSSDFGTKAYDFTVWMAEAAPAMTAVGEEMNEALNASLLGVTATSTSSIAIVSSGNVSLTVTPNKGYAIGMTVKIASVANPVNYIKGTVTAFTSLTGAMTVAVFNKGGSGTFADWSVFFDVPDPSVLSVPTGEAVAAGNLIAADDAGSSLSATALTTAVLQAVTATSLYACPLSNGNTAIFWTAGSTDYRMMIVDKAGATVLASTSVATGINSEKIWAAQLTDGNIALTYGITGSGVFKVINQTGGVVVAETIIETATLNVQPKCCALTGGGFTVLYATTTASKYAVYTNAGAVTKAATVDTTATITSAMITNTAAGGFVTMSGTATAVAGRVYNSAGTFVSIVGLNFAYTTEFGLASKNGVVVGAGGASATPTFALSADTGNAPINHTGAIAPVFSDGRSLSSNLLLAFTEALGNGNYIATYSPIAASNEYPRYTIFTASGQSVESGVLFAEVPYPTSPVIVIPKDTNGFSLIWLAANKNIKFAQVKSGNLLGVSLGAVGANHQYLASGSVSLASGNILNVGSSKVNYRRMGAKVVI